MLGKRGLPNDDYDIAILARLAISLSDHGEPYRGNSSPWWYSPSDLHQLMQQVTPTNTTVARLCRDMGFTLDGSADRPHTHARGCRHGAQSAARSSKTSIARSARIDRALFRTAGSRGSFTTGKRFG